jgi:hypothetical protein
MTISMPPPHESHNPLSESTHLSAQAERKQRLTHTQHLLTHAYTASQQGGRAW